MATITHLETHDLRFPTSRELNGSDAMNPAPDYSAAYVILRTDEGPDGHGFTFTIGRGNEVCVAAIQAYAPLVTGLKAEDIVDDLGGFAHRLSGDSQLRWLGPEKGVIHLAMAALVNAAFDLAGKRAGLPVWRLLSQMTPEQLVNLVDWRYLTNALTPEEALDILRAAESGREERAKNLMEGGYPGYATSPGWLGHSDEHLVHLANEAVAAGFTQIKLKVGVDLDSDVRRMGLVRQAVGPDVGIAIDANQRWEVGEAITWTHRLTEFDPSWIEEPTSPDDVFGHASIREAVAPIKVATGEHTQNRVVFKQMLQAKAIDIAQLDACRVGGVSENVAILLLAAKYGIPVCPHAGGVGLCEVVQHLSMFDYVAVSGGMDGRMIEYVDHLHEHFLDPVRVRGGRYRAPDTPGMSAEILPDTLRDYAYPGGTVWSAAKSVWRTV